MTDGSTTTTADEKVSVVEKRARFERFSMTVLEGSGSGRINIRNDSYGSEAGEHIYNVRVEGNEAVECNCPADEWQSGPCKHRVAVSERPLVLSAAQAQVAGTRQAVTDGGQEQDDRFRLPEDPEHVEERDVVDVSPCPGCSRLTQHDTCGRTRCEGTEIDETPL
jgi:hypothetical protein